MFEAFFQSLRGCGLPEPTLHQYADGCHPGDSVVQQITNASHFSRGEGEAQSCLNHPCKRDIKGNGMEGGKKRNDKWKNHNLPRGNRAKLNRFGNTRMENNATVNFTARRVPRVTLTGCWRPAPAFGGLFWNWQDFTASRREASLRRNAVSASWARERRTCLDRSAWHANHMGHFTGVYKCQSQEP